MDQADRVHSTPPTNTSAIRKEFASLAEAEAFLQSEGFHLVPNSCNWTNAAGDDAGVYAVDGRYGAVKAWRVEIKRSSGGAVESEDAPSRRRFLSQADGVAAGGAAMALAAIPATVGEAASAASVASPGADSELLRLEEEILQAWEACHANDDELYGACGIDELRRAEYDRLLAQEKERGSYISARERWDVVYQNPEVRRLDQLVVLSEQHFERMAGLVEQMWGIPAKTEAGRSAKVQVLLTCVMDWRDPDEAMDWRPLMARRLLTDLVTGVSR